MELWNKDLQNVILYFVDMYFYAREQDTPEFNWDFNSIISELQSKYSQEYLLTFVYSPDSLNFSTRESTGDYIFSLIGKQFNK